jgi:hypothetical protein
MTASSSDVSLTSLVLYFAALPVMSGHVQHVLPSYLFQEWD